MDYERESNCFVIRDATSGKVSFKIPQTFLATPANTKAIAEQVKFMTWVDNKTIRLIDISRAEPFEKIIKITSP